MRRSANTKLPSAAASTLRNLYANAPRTRAGLIKAGTWENELLNGYIAKLRYAGWTLQAIGNPLGITRERVRQRVEDAADVAYRSSGLPDAPVPQTVSRPRKAAAPKMRPEFEQWLRDTYATAVRCRGTHAVGSPERIASEKLWAAIDSAMKQGIKGSDIARVLGVSVRATIYAGLRRHGYRKQSASQQTLQSELSALMVMSSQEPMSDSSMVILNARSAVRVSAQRRFATGSARLSWPPSRS